MQRLRLTFLGFLFIQLVFVGCKHGDRGTVSGTLVHKDGSPLVGATVVGRSDDGKAVHGLTDANGHFELGVEQKGDGALPGEYRLMISEDRGDSDHKKPATISGKYNNANTSGLSVKVSSGNSAKIEFKLDPPP